MNIFKEGVAEYLAESGVSEKEINKIKFRELKEDTLKTLRKVLSHIEKDNFSSIDPLTEYSPSGDGHGRDNDYICFGEGSDILERVTHLKNLL